MKKNTTAIYHDFESLGEDAKALLSATADIAEHKVVEARKRLTVALERSQAIWEAARATAINGATATDEAIRRNPYGALGYALGAGTLLGILLARRR